MIKSLASLVAAAALTLAASLPTPATSPRADASYVLDSGLEIEVVRESQPTFVAYFLVSGGRYWVYQGDTGWQYAHQYEVTFANWPYSSWPLVLAAYRGDPYVGSRSVRLMGYTMVNGGRIISG